MLTSRNLGSVLNLWVNYASIAAPLVQPAVVYNKNEVVVSFQVDQKLVGFHPLIIELLLGVIKSNVKSLTAKNFDLNGVSVSFSAPAYAERYERLLECPVCFNQPLDQIRFDAALLDLPLTMTNPAGEQLATHQCEKALMETGATKALSNEIKSILTLLMAKSPTVEQLASSFNMSERTLRRRLSEEGTSFRQLLQEVRFDAAKHHLLYTDKYIEQISFDLGYNETSNFRSAFKSWSGLSPKQWRIENRR
ncbi:AraC family transcriptional regulator [Alkalimarinus alittae]|uniref:AraC family transcriptional regulator n=2 Tax=Alkalimarinus alittae TaxID=2961619 RepID=A0ABY6MZS6_9ALTE|nr:AraC family transcriptional regulator [Alkalimarinus alittae]